jgi:thymidylate kinase
MTDKIKNWYALAEKDGLANKIKNDRNFNRHFIRPCQMIGVIGQTGSGKTTAVVEFLSRKNNAFYKVYYFTGSTADEPLLRLLQQNMEGIEVIDKPEDLPELTDMNEEDKKTEKLFVFDDFQNTDKKTMKKIEKWSCSARKYGFTCFFLAQNFPEIPLQIRRNIHIYMIFRMNDNNTLNNILRTHNVSDVSKETVKKMYNYATAEKGNFFTIDLNGDKDKMFRQNFTNFLNPKSFERKIIFDF